MNEKLTRMQAIKKEYQEVRSAALVAMGRGQKTREYTLKQDELRAEFTNLLDEWMTLNRQLPDVERKANAQRMIAQGMFSLE